MDDHTYAPTRLSSLFCPLSHLHHHVQRVRLYREHCRYRLPSSKRPAARSRSRPSRTRPSSSSTSRPSAASPRSTRTCRRCMRSTAPRGSSSSASRATRWVLSSHSRQFKAQEPGTDDEILQFCQANYGVTFPIAKKGDVNGADATELYQFLKGHATPPVQAIDWVGAKGLAADDRTLQSSLFGPGARFSGSRPGRRPSRMWRLRWVCSGCIEYQVNIECRVTQITSISALNVVI